MNRSLLFLAIFLVSACNHVRPYRSPYDGLVPQGYKMPVSKSFSTAGMREKTVAVVTSANFESYAEWWLDYFERGGAESARSNIAAATTVLQGAEVAAIASAASERGQPFARKAGDPRRLTDAVARQLQGNFGKVIVATDFADARERGAHYIVLVDFHLTPNGWGNSIDNRAGLYMHDAALNQLFVVEKKFSAHRSMRDISAATAFNNALTEAVKVLTDGLATNLAPR